MPASDEDQQSRTEPPTQRRREEARQQGQVAVSADLGAALMLLAGVLALWFGTRMLAGGLLNSVRHGLLAGHCGADLSSERVSALLFLMLRQGLELIGPLLLLLFAVGGAVGMLQAGVHFVPDLLAFNWERLSPANGWSRLFSMASAMRGLTSILKVAALAWLAYWVLQGRFAVIANLGEGSVSSASARGWEIAMRLALAIAGALALIGVADYGFQRWRLERSLRMTRQELREELKREEGDPQIKARIRRLQREAAQRRMLEAVPGAAVVITNPTHLAIALRYERGSMPAPRVVAKGRGFVAQKIAELARSHAVPVLERKSLAQAIFKAVEVDEEIPGALYYAVAEVLAYVYRLSAPASTHTAG